MNEDARNHTPGQADLLSLFESQPTQEIPPGLGVLADAARACHGDSVRAVLFYGSCLRRGDVHEGLADLYLLVDDYRSAFKSPVLAFFNRLLPPNVFYLEVPWQGHQLRAKYAVLSLEDFRKGTTSWFHSYIWGRFAQRCGIVYVSDDSVTRQVREALASAVLTFVTRTLPQTESPFTARDLWVRGLSLSYRAELRTEQPGVAARLFDADPDYYQRITDVALGSVASIHPVKAGAAPPSYQALIPLRSRRLNRAGWFIRALQGKLLSVLRLLKGFFTFKGGVDYIQWKIERHSGARVDVSPGLKRIPPLALVVIFWRLYRRGAFR